MLKMNVSVFLPSRRLAVDEDIIKIAWCKISQRTKNVRDHPVECGRCVFQALRHHQPLPQHPAWGADSCIRNIRFAHADLVKSVLQVNRTEDCASDHAVDDHVLSWDR